MKPVKTFPFPKWRRQDLARPAAPNPEFGPRVEPWEDGRNNLNNGRVREQLMRQFCQTSGPKGNSSAYLKGYERIKWSPN